MRKFSNYLEEVITSRIEESSNFEKGKPYNIQLKELESEKAEVEKKLEEAKEALDRMPRKQRNEDISEESKVVNSLKKKLASINSQINYINGQREINSNIYDARMER